MYTNNNQAKLPPLEVASSISRSNGNVENFLLNNDCYISDDNNLSNEFSRMSIGNLHGSVLGPFLSQGGAEGWHCPTNVGHVGSSFYGIDGLVGYSSSRYFDDQMDYLDQTRGSGYGSNLRGFDQISGLSRHPFYAGGDRAGFYRGGNVGLGFEGNLVMQERRANHLTDKGKGHADMRKNIGLNGDARPWEINGNGESMCRWSALFSESSLSERKGHIYSMAKDQSGCRFLQDMLDEGTAVDDIFNEVVSHIVELTMNPFGNYLVQKLLLMCTDEQRMKILLRMIQVPGQLVGISLSSHGTRVVQMLIETVKGRPQISLLKSALEPGFLDLFMNLNGAHVLQTCLKCLSNEDNAFIFRAATKYSLPIATHQYGCCVLQRCIEYATGEYLKILVNEISANGLYLAQHRFGNYVIQFIIKLESRSAAAILNSQFQGNYVHLSMQKCSSHVVEKCLVHFKEFRPAIVQELTSVAQFDKLMQDPYANYVINSALSVTKGRLHASLVHAVQPHKMLRTSPFCKRIFSFINTKK